MDKKLHIVGFAGATTIYFHRILRSPRFDIHGICTLHSLCEAAYACDYHATFSQHFCDVTFLSERSLYDS
jgi:hypothetical protein